MLCRFLPQLIGVLLGLGVILSTGCSSVDTRLQTLYQSTEVIRSGRCEAYRLHPGRPGKSGIRLHGYEVLDGPVSLDRQSHRQLTDILLDPNNYQWTPSAFVKPCNFEPAVLFRFESRRRSMDILYSFVCGRLMVFQGRRKKTLQDASPAHNPLLFLSRNIFPHDTYLQLMPLTGPGQ